MDETSDLKIDDPQAVANVKSCLIKNGMPGVSEKSSFAFGSLREEHIKDLNVTMRAAMLLESKNPDVPPGKSATFTQDHVYLDEVRSNSVSGGGMHREKAVAISGIDMLKKEAHPSSGGSVTERVGETVLGEIKADKQVPQELDKISRLIDCFVPKTM